MRLFLIKSFLFFAAFFQTVAFANSPDFRTLSNSAFVMGPGSSSNEIDAIWQPFVQLMDDCLLYTSPSPRDQRGSRMPSSA